VVGARVAVACVLCAVQNETMTPPEIMERINKILKVFYLPTDAKENYFKNNIKIYIKTAPTCFGLITVIRERII
jgi:hypothetical protein